MTTIVFRLTALVVVLLAAVGTSSCSAGSGEGLDLSGRPLSEGGDLPLAATLASIQANVFDPSCIVCHAGASAPQGLRLDSASSFTSLVGVPSRQGGALLVDPGNPDNSYLIRKLEGTAAVGEQMPLGGPPIPQVTIDFVRQWIADGALPDSGGPLSGQPPVVITLSPAADSAGPAFPAEIVAGFDQEIDASTVNDLTFTLIRSGGDDQFTDGNEIAITPASVMLSAANPRVALMDLTGVSAVEDRYRVTLEGTGPNVILGISGAALDGEFSGSLPSGDGVEGGDFVAQFELQGLQASLASIQANVFSISCAAAGCHSGPAGPNLPTGMDLTSEDASFDSLVNVPSAQDPMTLRINPRDADASYLVRKLDGTAATGSRMPLGGPFLDQETIDVIRLWIDTGAQR